jgi:signal transduction histidine kinase
MAKKDSPHGPGELRRRAQERLDDAKVDAAGEAQTLLHELQVHQIELELQNEELLRAQAEAAENLARYADLYELAPVGYFTLDRSGAIQRMNLTGSQLLDLPRAPIGQRFGLRMAAESLPVFNGFLERVFATGAQQVCELSLDPEETKARTLELTATVTPQGQECRVVAVDITARRHAEAQLAEAQKMEAIGTLAGGIAHDFNNILHGMLGGLSMLELHRSGEHRAEIQEMKALVERGANLARQLLGFARRGKYDVKPLDLGLVVAKTSETFARTHRNVAIGLDVAPALRPVLMDHTQLEQVLLNLLTNADQAMPDGGRIVLRAENVALAQQVARSRGVEPGSFVKLTISDTGSGMDAATQARIFEPFFTTKAPGRSSGLGLASAYGIIGSHGGFITVESRLRVGTTFTLFLPATERADEQELQGAAPLAMGTGTILIVDDEELILKVCAQLLRTAGYQVLTASSGKKAIELLSKHREGISLVVLDMIMPDMNGRQTFEALRQIMPDIKVLLASGFTREAQARALLELGCSGFIQKPFGPGLMLEKVQEILAPQRER